VRLEAWRFILWWSLATAAGVAASAVLFLPITSVVEGPVHKGLAGISVGIGLGVGQWLFLRHRFDDAVWWIAATVVGFGIAGTAMGVGTTAELAKRGLASETVGFVLGATAGTAQWMVLRRQSDRALWWIPASTAAFGLG